MGQLRGGLVRRHHPHRGTHLPNRGVVPLQQTARHHPLGADPRPPRAPSTLRPCSVPTRRQTRSRSSSGLSCAGNWRSPFRRCGPIWAWKPNASGPTWPSPVPRPSCWVSFPGPPWPPTALQKHHPITQRTAAWYDKPSPTFVDAIALVRRHLWLASEGFSLSVADPDTQELPVALYHRLVDSLAYAA